jgi:hypothetical protein|uniref:Uncharacterized protein n=1 Tax=viral metagenome TaxID=1070528 RepID=A0A6C0BVC9_9ZZZZ
MLNKYTISGTSNIDSEQASGPYLDENFWPTFQEDMENFKKNIKNHFENNTSYHVLRVGHAEYCFLSRIVPDDTSRQGKLITKQILPRHYSGKQTIKQYIDCYESLLSVDCITTQIGWDFKGWLNDIIHFRDQYKLFKQSNNLTELFNHTHLFNKNYKIRSQSELMNFPLDIIYGLIANKWLLKEFKNQIGLIGNEKKLELIKKLLEHNEYKKYIENDYFIEYVNVPQRQAIEDDNIEKKILEQIKNSKCKIFFVGMGMAKLKFFNKIRKITNAIIIDVGYGLDAIAGVCDCNRPYFGSWQNYKLNNYNYSHIDMCGSPSWNNVITI